MDDDALSRLELGVLSGEPRRGLTDELLGLVDAGAVRLMTETTRLGPRHTVHATDAPRRELSSSETRLRDALLDGGQLRQAGLADPRTGRRVRAALVSTRAELRRRRLLRSNTERLVLPVAAVALVVALAATGDLVAPLVSPALFVALVWVIWAAFRGRDLPTSAGRRMLREAGDRTTGPAGAHRVAVAAGDVPTYSLDATFADPHVTDDVTLNPAVSALNPLPDLVGSLDAAWSGLGGGADGDAGGGE